MEISYKHYLTILLFLPLFCFISLSAFNYTIDPYMLWHQHPVWYDKTKNPEIDHHQRLVKALQVVVRQPDIVFLGSSRVYHTINPQQAADQRTYNLGLGSLRMTEAYGYAREVVKWTSVKKIYLALDLFAFGSEQQMPGYDDDIDTFQYLTNQFIGSLIGKAVTGYSIGIIKGKDRDYNDGTWQFDGYKNTPKRSPEVISTGLNDYQLLYKKIFADRADQYISSNLRTLEDIIKFCQKNHVGLVLYFNPENNRLLNTYMKMGLFKHFTKIKSDTAMMASKHHIQVWDFDTLNVITRYPFSTDAEISRNPYYLDVDHGSELTGNAIMQKMGITLKKPVDVPSDFGELLNA